LGRRVSDEPSDEAHILKTNQNLKPLSHLNVRQSHRHSGSVVVEALGLKCEVWGSSSLGCRFSVFYKELMPWVRWRLRGSEVASG
jgi:hypothetical protein